MSGPSQWVFAVRVVAMRYAFLEVVARVGDNQSCE